MVYCSGELSIIKKKKEGRHLFFSLFFWSIKPIKQQNSHEYSRLAEITLSKFLMFAEFKDEYFFSVVSLFQWKQKKRTGVEELVFLVLPHHVCFTWISPIYAFCFLCAFYWTKRCYQKDEVSFTFLVFFIIFFDWFLNKRKTKRNRRNSSVVRLFGHHLKTTFSHLLLLFLFSFFFQF